MSKRGKKPTRKSGASDSRRSNNQSQRKGSGNADKSGEEKARRPFFKPGRKSEGPAPGSPNRDFARERSELEYRDQLITPGQREEVAQARRKTDEAIRQWLAEAKVAAAKSRADPQDHLPIIDRLDPWQREAYEALMNGEHVIVDAPTTAGKTRVVEAYFELNIGDPTFRAAYTTPVKSLSNDKLKEFTETFGRENVGIATGDIKENLDAPIVVATLESYRNSLLGVEPDLGRSLVIFDEYHFMQDTSRGSAWEEAIILTPPSCQLLLLSASVDNAPEFCSWIETLTNRRCRLIQVKERPVPLVDLVYWQEQWLLVEAVANILPKKAASPSKFPIEHDEIARRLSTLPSLGLTPAILYAGRRLSCENLAMEMCRQLEPIPKEQAQAIHDLLAKDAGEEDPLKFFKPNLKRSILVYGVGYHHSGLAPQARRAVENLVKAGQLRICVATMGLSIGINFSVRSAMVTDYSRPGEMGFTTYSASEVLQMLGRAGRRGRDVVGFSLWPSVQAYQKFGGTRREDCESRLKNDPTTFLGLLGRGFKLRDIENFYEKSFLRFGNKNVSFNLIRDQPLKKALGVEELFPVSPAHAYSLHLAEDPTSPLIGWPDQEAFLGTIKSKMDNPLSHLHVHLHTVGCIDGDERLTSLGSIARYFPQSGGMLIAFLIDRGDIDVPNLLAGLELMGSMCLSRFKDPRIPEDYDYPFDAKEVDEMLQEFYPLELFEELYDPPNARREGYVFREFNPLGGALISEWVKGMSWAEMVKRSTDEKFGQGDLMSLFYRAATYLQSIVQAKIPKLSAAAAQLRDEILREPLTPSVKALAPVSKGELIGVEADDEDEDLEVDADLEAAAGEEEN
ncbi:MAG: DEAD/DEAH box helicase [Chitinophagaceae bacterium]|nr:DEAD/DEAH box helicase [Oligoflexus sp.]